ncbi:MAG TPA: hypothetical protein VFE99_05795 [Agromyces sp.]|nr:hypothetical protein [Agromyces sp.]
MHPRSAAIAVAVAVAATFAIGSCSPSYDAATRDGLRQQVVAVAQASAAGDWDAAIQDLDVMAAQLSDAREAGRLSDDRFNAILLAIELVRQDIDEAIAAETDAAERQRLIDEQARLQQQIAELENQQGEQNQQDKPNQQRSGEDKGDNDGNGGEGKRGDDSEGHSGKGE